MELLLRAVVFGQSIYFIVTGIWPIVHMRSFLAMTGPKTDLWLVRTVGLLVTVIGATILVAGLRSELTMAVVVLGIGSAIALSMIDFVYSMKGTISKVYLLDALAEVVFIALWLVACLFAWQGPRG